MSIKISLKKNISEKLIKNYAVFSNETFKINALSKILLNKDSKLIENTIKNSVTNKNNFVYFNINPNQKLIIIKLKKNLSSLENEKKGAEFYSFIKSNSIYNLTFLEKNVTENQSK